MENSNNISNLISQILTNLSLPRKAAYNKFTKEGYWPKTEHNPLQDELLFHTDFRDKMSRALSLAIEIQTIFTECGVMYEEEIRFQEENNKEERYQIRKPSRDSIPSVLDEECSIHDFDPTIQIP